MKVVLHAGCGQHKLPPWFDQYQPLEEVRLDIEPKYHPDIIGSITAIHTLSERFDAVSCSHTLEHLYPYEVPVALAEFRRVLKPGGFVMVMVPDLEDVRPTEEVLYSMPCGGMVCGLDLIYGLRWTIEQSVHMAHHCGFTAVTLQKVMEQAGFSQVVTKRMAVWNLLGVGVK